MLCGLDGVTLTIVRFLLENPFYSLYNIQSIFRKPQFQRHLLGQLVLNLSRNYIQFEWKYALKWKRNWFQCSLKLSVQMNIFCSIYFLLFPISFYSETYFYCRYRILKNSNIFPNCQSFLRWKCKLFSLLSTAQKVSVFGVFLVRIQPECGKIETRKTPNIDTFHVVKQTETMLLRYQKETQTITKNNEE